MFKAEHLLQSTTPDNAVARATAILSDTALIQHSSAAIFKRGSTYALAGAVTIETSEDSPTFNAAGRVSGTDLYRVKLQLTEPATINGSCTCVGYQSGYFCKHMVAFGIVWRHQLGGTIVELDEASRKKVAASAKRVQTVEQNVVLLVQFLKSQSSAVLAERLIEMAGHDSYVERQLQSWRKSSIRTDDPAKIKLLITQVMAIGKSFLEWRESIPYVNRAREVLKLLDKEIQANPASAVPLCMHAIKRCWVTMEHADDSDGSIGIFCDEIGVQLNRALKSAGPQNAKFGDIVLQLLLDDDYGSFDHAAALASIGPAALTQYRKSVTKQWRDALQAYRDSSKQTETQTTQERLLFRQNDQWNEARRLQGRMESLKELHRIELEAQGDSAAVIDLLKTDLSDIYDFEILVKYLEAHGMYREALEQAEQANRQFVNDDRAATLLVHCYESDGWTEEAFAIRHKQFFKQPDSKTLAAVLLAGKSSSDLKNNDTVQLKSVLMASILDSQINFAKKHNYEVFFDSTAQILIDEKEWSQLLGLLDKGYLCRDQLLHTIGMLLPEKHADRAVAILSGLLHERMKLSVSPHKETLRLVSDIFLRLAPKGREILLEQLATQYRHKVAFVRDLPPIE